MMRLPADIRTPSLRRYCGRGAPKAVAFISSTATAATLFVRYLVFVAMLALWEEKSEAINLAIAAAPGLFEDVGIMHPEGVQIGYFLEAFCQEYLGEFCHQVPLADYGELILTSMETEGGMLPAVIDINGVQILRFQLRDLLDLHNLTLWSQGVFYSGNDE